MTRRMLVELAQSLVAVRAFAMVSHAPLIRAFGPPSPPGEKERLAPYVFIESKKPSLFLVCLSLSMRNSMASVVPMGARMRRRT